MRRFHKLFTNISHTKGGSQNMGLKKAVHFLFGRMAAIGFFILLQLAFFLVGVLFLAQNTMVLYLGLKIVSIGVVLWMIVKEENPSYKIAWITAILIFPLVGGLFYLMCGNKRVPRRHLKQMEPFYRSVAGAEASFPEDSSENRQQLKAPIHYIAKTSGFPIWNHTQTSYHPTGESFFKALTAALGQAQKFIFLEYFIVEPGRMWDTIHKILREKAAAGVEIRLLYDDLGCIQTLPAHYARQLESEGIRTGVFNPFRPHLNMAMNYRDHRKICVIDGNVGFCGGINLADEYINEIVKHGHWKDTAVQLYGEGVWNLTLMFLTLWHFTTRQELPFDRYRPTASPPSDGWVQPFGDSPLDRYNVAENAYMQMIHRASQYLYLTTPYLILDHEMISALTVAAQSGIDVRIITPNIPDKRLVHAVTRAHYATLVRAGVRIFEYTPGFIHAKMFLCDDHQAIVGTANMDYRSFYLHFECGVAIYQSSVIPQIKEDFLATQALCQEVTREELAAVSPLKRMIQALLRIFSPLM